MRTQSRKGGRETGKEKEKKETRAAQCFSDVPIPPHAALAKITPQFFHGFLFSLPSQNLQPAVIYLSHMIHKKLV